MLTPGPGGSTLRPEYASLTGRQQPRFSDSVPLPPITPPSREAFSALVFLVSAMYSFGPITAAAMLTLSGASVCRISFADNARCATYTICDGIRRVPFGVLSLHGCKWERSPTEWSRSGGHRVPRIKMGNPRPPSPRDVSSFIKSKETPAGTKRSSTPPPGQRAKCHEMYRSIKPAIACPISPSPRTSRQSRQHAHINLNADKTGHPNPMPIG